MRAGLVSSKMIGVNLQNWRKEPIYHATSKICCKKDCDHNGDVQTIDEFTKQPSTTDGRSRWCRSCQKKYRVGREKQKLADNSIKAF